MKRVITHHVFFETENDRTIMYGGTIATLNEKGKIINKKIYPYSERVDVTDIIAEMEKDRKRICPGCQRELDEPHKMCPAWGTSYYMSGKLFTKEAEEETREERDASLEMSRKKAQEMWDQGIDPSGLS